MADKWGALAQIAPAATTLTLAYTVLAGKQSTVEAVICNRGAAATVRLSHAIAGAADAVAQYLLYDYAIAAGESKVTARFTMNEADLLRVYASTATVTFNINGIEEDV